MGLLPMERRDCFHFCNRQDYLREEKYIGIEILVGRLSKGSTDLIRGQRPQGSLVTVFILKASKLRIFFNRKHPLAQYEQSDEEDPGEGM